MNLPSGFDSAAATFDRFRVLPGGVPETIDRKSTRLNSSH